MSENTAKSSSGESGKKVAEVKKVKNSLVERYFERKGISIDAMLFTTSLEKENGRYIKEDTIAQKTSEGLDQDNKVINRPIKMVTNIKDKVTRKGARTSKKAVANGKAKLTNEQEQTKLETAKFEKETLDNDVEK